MENANTPAPTRCPSCGDGLVITRLHCPACRTEVGGAFRLSRLASLPDPYAALIELFLRSRGNMKEMEREMGLSYPTVRARLEEALTAAGFGRSSGHGEEESNLATERSQILEALERQEITVQEATSRLVDLKTRRTR